MVTGTVSINNPTGFVTCIFTPPNGFVTCIFTPPNGLRDVHFHASQRKQVEKCCAELLKIDPLLRTFATWNSSRKNLVERGRASCVVSIKKDRWNRWRNYLKMERLRGSCLPSHNAACVWSYLSSPVNSWTSTDKSPRSRSSHRTTSVKRDFGKSISNMPTGCGPTGRGMGLYTLTSDSLLNAAMTRSRTCPAKSCVSFLKYTWAWKWRGWPSGYLREDILFLWQSEFHLLRNDHRH